MKSQPQTTTPQVLPLSSLSPVTGTGEPLGINSAHHSLLTTPTCVPHPLSFRPLFPVMSAPFFPIGSLVSPVNVPSSARPMLTPTGSLPASNLYQIFNVPRPGLQPHSRSASESSSLGGVSNDTRMESGGILDVDTSRSSLSECEGSSNGSNPCPMGLRAGSPVQLQQIIEENCREYEFQIETSFNVSYKHASISTTTTTSTRPSVGTSALDRPSVLHVAPPRQLPGVNQGASPPLLPIKPITQVSASLTPQPTAAQPTALPLIPLSPSVVPIATPTLQYPFTPTMSPYAFLPSIIQSDSSPRPQYYIKLLPSNSISSVQPIVHFMQTTPTATPQAITTTSYPFPLTPNMLSYLSATSSPQVLETTKHSTTSSASDSSTANTSGTGT